MRPDGWPCHQPSSRNSAGKGEDEMVDEAQASQSAPSAPPMVAPAQQAAAVEKALPKRRKRAGGRPKVSEQEKAQRQQAREQALKDRAEQQARTAEARKGVARLAAIGALTPHLLSLDEISGLAKFALAMVGQQPGEGGQS